MLKKLRWRFIGAAMVAFLSVTLALLCAVNACSYKIMTDRLDSTLQMLMGFSEKKDRPFRPEDIHIPDSSDGVTPEFPYMLRFFAAHRGSDGAITSLDQEFIASISTGQATDYASHAFQSRKKAGYYKSYRFLKNERETTVVFLNSERELWLLRTTFLLSGIVALSSMCTVFLLVFFLSRRAIAPYVRNIETQKRFITDAGHELKTPLTAISTSADILAMETPDNEWVQNIQKQSAHLTRLVINLVRLSRLDEEQPFPERTVFSLSEAVWEISEPAAALAKAAGKEYEQQIADGISFLGDRAAIQQMVSLLLDNALRYSDEGGTIRLAVWKKHRKFMIEVYNTCILEEPEKVERLFDRFYRPDQSRSTHSGGTGIGLSIVKSTVEAHGGKITVKSPDGASILFRSTFKCCPAGYATEGGKL